MRRIRPLVRPALASVTAALAVSGWMLVGLAGTAEAATTPTVTITGTLLGRPGMTVLALSPNGKAKPVKLTSTGSFTFHLTPAAAHDATLQLVDARGRYAGPVVLAKTPGKAYTALAGVSTNLGALHLESGWAWVTRSLPSGTVDVLKPARADSLGKPLGAGKLGFVKTVGTHAAAATDGDPSVMAGGPAPTPTSGGGDDPDGDGVPNLFDADDNGNGRLDATDPTTPAAPGIDVRLSTAVTATFRQTVNANAGAITPSRLDALLANNFALNFYVSEMTLDRAYTGIDVDCFTLTYCAPHTGTATMDGVGGHPTRWVDYDLDGSGLPNLTHDAGGHSWQINVLPHVTSANIHPGDAFEINLRAGTDVVSVPRSLSSYFVTTPAVTQWADGTGTPVAVSYPVTTDGPSQLNASSGRLTMSFWGPQRPGIPGADETSFVDFGHLRYGLILGIPGGPEVGCGGFFSGLSPTLRDESPVGSHNAFWPLHDQADDHAPSADRTMSFTVDLRACARAAGYDPTGHTLNVRLQAVTDNSGGGMDRSGQEFTVSL